MNKNIGIMAGVVLLIALVSLGLVNAHGSERGINVGEKSNSNSVRSFFKNVGGEMMGNMRESNKKEDMMNENEHERVSNNKHERMREEMHEKMEKLMESGDFEGMRNMHEEMEEIYESKGGNFKEKGSCPMMD